MNKSAIKSFAYYKSIATAVLRLHPDGIERDRFATILGLRFVTRSRKARGNGDYSSIRRLAAPSKQVLTDLEAAHIIRVEPRSAFRNAPMVYAVKLPATEPVSQPQDKYQGDLRAALQAYRDRQSQPIGAHSA